MERPTKAMRSNVETMEELISSLPEGTTCWAFSITGSEDKASSPTAETLQSWDLLHEILANLFLNKGIELEVGVKSLGAVIRGRMVELWGSNSAAIVSQKKMSGGEEEKNRMDKNGAHSS